MSEARATALGWIEGRQADWSTWNRSIWQFGETAWREYRSAGWYVDLLHSGGLTHVSGTNLHLCLGSHAKA
jgi:aminobenzoyl-glutamate utilization protein B